MNDGHNTLSIYQKIAAAVNAIPGHVAEVRTNPHGCVLFVDGTIFYNIEVMAERTRTTAWDSRPNGKFRVTVGGYGDKRQFPQRKDGSHDYATIADLIHLGVAAAKHAQQMKDRRDANADAAKAIREELGLREYMTALSVKPSTDPSKPFAVSVEFKATVDEAKLRKIHAALKALGVSL